MLLPPPRDPSSNVYWRGERGEAGHFSGLRPPTVDVRDGSFPAWPTSGICSRRLPAEAVASGGVGVLSVYCSGEFHEEVVRRWATTRGLTKCGRPLRPRNDSGKTTSSIEHLRAAKDAGCGLASPVER